MTHGRKQTAAVYLVIHHVGILPQKIVTHRSRRYRLKILVVTYSPICLVVPSYSDSFRRFGHITQFRKLKRYTTKPKTVQTSGETLGGRFFLNQGRENCDTSVAPLQHTFKQGVWPHFHHDSSRRERLHNRCEIHHAGNVSSMVGRICINTLSRAFGGIIIREDTTTKAVIVIRLGKHHIPF